MITIIHNRFKKTIMSNLPIDKEPTKIQMVFAIAVIACMVTLIAIDVIRKFL